jgi:hypothetical protein
MTGVGQNKLIFTILLHGYSPEQFERRRQRRFERMYSDPGARERYQDEFNQSDPPFHRYNDVAGYAELYWDGGERILGELYIRGDRSRKYGKTVTNRMRRGITSPRWFYPFHVLYIEVGSVSRGARECENRQAIADALEWVRVQATDLGCFVDLTHERILLDAIDVNKLFSR